MPTNAPGLYWHKGAHYHDFKVVIPVPLGGFTGETLHLTAQYRLDDGYRLLLTGQGTAGRVQLYRQSTEVRQAVFEMLPYTHLVVTRRGSYLLVTRQQVDPDDQSEFADESAERLLLVYRDPLPRPAVQVGFIVTSEVLAAASVQVSSDRVQEAFEYAPVAWRAQSGIWAVMARYTCDPRWSWYGGFGAGMPAIWSKQRLEGDQTVEAYLGVKMAYLNEAEEYVRRYRDLNVTICGDGKRPESGYTVIRGGRIDGVPVSLLLRDGQTVQTVDSPSTYCRCKRKGIGSGLPRALKNMAMKSRSFSITN